MSMVWSNAWCGVGVRSETEVELKHLTAADVERVAAQLRSNMTYRKLTLVGDVSDGT